MAIEELVEELSRLRGAYVGRGPRHPSNPRRELAARTSGFLDSYPALRRDAGYVDFLEIYAGVMVTDEEDDTGIDIMGFDPGVANLAELEGPVVDDHGFLLISMCSYGAMADGKLTTWEYDFAFDTTGSRRTGIYCLVAVSGVTVRQFEWHVNTFEEWLSELLAKNGRYPLPAGS